MSSLVATTKVILEGKSNFVVWKSQIYELFISCEWADLLPVSGTVVSKAVKSSSRSVAEKQTKANALAKRSIRASVSDAIEARVRNAGLWDNGTAAEILVFLEKLFSSSGYAAKLRLIQEFYVLSRDSNTWDNFLGEIHRLRYALLSMDEEIPDLFLKAKVVANLPSSLKVHLPSLVAETKKIIGL